MDGEAVSLPPEAALGPESDLDDLMLIDRRNQCEIFPGYDRERSAELFAEVVGWRQPGTPEFVRAAKRRLSEVEAALAE